MNKNKNNNYDYIALTLCQASDLDVLACLI